MTDYEHSNLKDDIRVPLKVVPYASYFCHG